MRITAKQPNLKLCGALCVVGAALLLSTACEDGAPTSGTEPRSASARPACPNQATALARPTAGNLNGAVDDDAAPDDVSLAVDPEGDEGCRVFLEVRLGDGSASVIPVDQEGMSLDATPPRLVSLVEIDREPGAEIVVSVLSGASTEFVALFTLYDGELVRMSIEGRDPYGDLFPTGGSAGHMEASDCARPGSDHDVVVSTALPLERSVTVTTLQLRAAEGVFETVRTDEREVPQEALEEEFPEFFRSPFGSCSAA